jgi:hypothetical protein
VKKATPSHRRRKRATRAPRQGKTIAISAYDAEHVYDWLRMYWCDDDYRFGGCYECERLGRRLERLVGPAWVGRVTGFVNAERRNCGLARQQSKPNA